MGATAVACANETASCGNSKSSIRSASPIDLKAEQEYAFESFGPFGNRDDRYQAAETKVEFKFTPTPGRGIDETDGQRVQNVEELSAARLSVNFATAQSDVPSHITVRLGMPQSYASSA